MPVLVWLHRNPTSIHGKTPISTLFSTTHIFHIDLEPFSDGETCLAQSSDMRWYRANSHEKIDEKTYNLMYMDYGNMEQVPCDRIREMQEEFFFPCTTLLCVIDGKLINNLKEHANIFIHFCFYFDQN